MDGYQKDVTVGFTPALSAISPVTPPAIVSLFTDFFYSVQFLLLFLLSVFRLFLFGTSPFYSICFCWLAYSFLVWPICRLWNQRRSLDVLCQYRHHRNFFIGRQPFSIWESWPDVIRMAIGNNEEYLQYRTLFAELYSDFSFRLFLNFWQERVSQQVYFFSTQIDGLAGLLHDGRLDIRRAAGKNTIIRLCLFHCAHLCCSTAVNRSSRSRGHHF